MLREMIVKSPNKRERRLLFKYVLVELHSILQAYWQMPCFALRSEALPP
jgi:hypothetical protein